MYIFVSYLSYSIYCIMKITKKVRYGLRAMIEISLNTSTKGILQKEISENQEIKYGAGQLQLNFRVRGFAEPCFKLNRSF